MNKLTTFLALALGISLALFAGRSFAQGEWSYHVMFGDMKPYVQTAMEETAAQPGWSGFEASWFIGHRVFSPQHSSLALGQISDFVIDQTNDRIALVILSDVPGLGAKQIAVPYSSLVRSGEDDFLFSFGDRDLQVGNPYEGQIDIYQYNLTMAPSDSDLYGVPATIDPAWVDRLYRHYGQPPYWTERGEKSIASMDLYRYSSLMGDPVSSPKAEHLGRVDDLVIDASDGHIAFVAFRDVPGRGDVLVAVPFSTLSCKGEHDFVLNISKDKLASAPAFNEYADMHNREWAEGTYRFFGIQPYWTE